MKKPTKDAFTQAITAHSEHMEDGDLHDAVSKLLLSAGWKPAGPIKFATKGIRGSKFTHPDTKLTARLCTANFGGVFTDLQFKE